MDKSDIAEFKALYLQTAGEYLDKLQKNSSLTTDEMIDVVYMSAHSLKSQSLVMGYKHTGTLSGMIEKIGKALNEKTLALTPELKQEIQASIALLARSVARINTEDQEEDTASQVTTLTAASGISLS